MICQFTQILKLTIQDWHSAEQKFAMLHIFHVEKTNRLCADIFLSNIIILSGKNKN